MLSEAREGRREMGPWVAACLAAVAYPVLTPAVGRVRYLYVERDKFGRRSGGVGICEALVWPGKGERHLSGVMGIPRTMTLLYPNMKVEVREEGGRVVREAFEAACLCVHQLLRELKICDDFLHTHDVYLHFGEISVPKEGPSAGLAMAVAIFSAAVKAPVRGDVAVTGEITPRGALIRILGVPYKVEAALRAGIRTVILPAGNAKDVLSLPWRLKASVQIIAAPDVKVALMYALGPNGPLGGEFKRLAGERERAVALARQGRLSEAAAAFRAFSKKAPWDLSIPVWLEYLGMLGAR